MESEIIKSGKGHEIRINGVFVLWVIGSKKNAEIELKKHLETINK